MPSTVQNSASEPAQSDTQFALMITKPLEAWSPLLAGVQSWSQSFAMAHVSMQKEWLGFVERRLQHDAAFPKHLTACKALDEAWRVYSDFLQTAADDYRKEYTEIAKISSGIAGETLNVLQAAPANGASPALRPTLGNG